MIPFTDCTFNNLSWKPVDGKKLDNLIEGLTVVGSEPTDYPLTDALTLYFRNKSGAILAINIDTETETGAETGLYILAATAEQDTGH
jgi:hypothetical protein